MNLFLRIALLFFLTTICFSGFTQPNPNLYNYKPTIHSPNVAGLGEFGQIPVSLYNGKTQISIPLYEMVYHDLKVPISLIYNSAGNRVETRPSWVGLGWSLQAGGVIMRVTNNLPDEFGVFNSSSSYVDDHDYYSKKHLLAASDWKTKYFHVTDHFEDGPDEFVFNFLGISGSFYLDHTGQWQVKSKENLHLRVEHEYQTNLSVENPLWSNSIVRTYSRFILTNGEGIKYVFGGNLNSIEFTRSAYLDGSCHCADVGLISSAWHLTEIQSPKGNIQFNYERVFNLTQVLFSSIGKSTNTHEWEQESLPQDVNKVNPVINYNSYLTEIKGGQDILISLNKSASNDLKYSYKDLPRRFFPGFYEPVSGEQVSPEYFSTGFSKVGLVYDYFDQLDKSLVDSYSNYYKLNSIDIKDQSLNVVRKIALDYISNPSERLKLLSVGFQTATGTSMEEQYTFDYNPLKLPNYHTGFIDHWGFYNGKNYDWPVQLINSFPAFPNINQYYHSRESDPNFMQAEMLTKIIYPTKGYTEFTYEPHDYSFQVQSYPLSISSVTNSKIETGGLRIKKIINKDGITNKTKEREFFYLKDYLQGGIKSSGVISGLPEYYAERSDGNYIYKSFSSDPNNRMNHSDGNHVTYSEVIEKTSEEGYFLYKYKNHDNGYLDKEVFSLHEYGDRQIYRFNKYYGSLDLERGLLNEKHFYSKDKALVKKETLSYNDDSNRYDQYVRGYQSQFASANAYILVSYPIFTFIPYLKKTEERLYMDNVETIINSVELEYDNLTHKKLLKKVFNNSKGEIKISTYKYSDDFAPLSPYNYMVDNNILSPIIEEVEYIGNTSSIPIRSVKNSYSVWDTNFTHIYPSEVATKLGNALNYDPIILYHGYDNKGNMQSVSKVAGPQLSYIWGYNKQYRTAEVINAKWDEIAYTSFEGSVTDTFDDWVLFPMLQPTSRPAAILSSYVYTDYHLGGTSSNVSILDSKTLPLKDYTFSLFAKGNGDITVNGIVKNIAGDWKIYIWNLSNITTVQLQNPSGLLIDDLRIHPKDAHMTTYTYKPLVGMTSMTDPAGRTTYYEYDGFHRLKNVKDAEGNILKHTDYHYQNQ